MTDSIPALERKAERSRGRLSGLIDDLQEQMSPGQVLDRIMGFAKTDGSDFSRSLAREISTNPLPYVLIAVGIGWLLISDANSRKAGKSRTQRKPRGRRRK
jgi:hypothetical protein